MNLFSDDERRRYARHLVMDAWGEPAQAKLKQARVLVIGAGGLGSAAITYLAASGIGTLGIADHDRVELSNLQRQILHETGDVGRAKIESARDRVEELNPHVRVEIHAVRVDEENALPLVTSYDLVLDGSDNFETRIAVASACHHAAKTLVSAAIRRFEGQITTFKSYLGAPHPCYRCFVGDTPPDHRTCAETGILGPVAGLLGSWQALEASKEIASVGESLSGTLLRIDGLTGLVKRSQLLRDPACPICA